LLLWAYLYSDNNYLVSVLKYKNNFSGFENKIYSNIVSFLKNDKFWSYYDNRKKIINNLNLPVDSQTFAFLEDLKHYDKIRCLTDCTAFERELVLGFVSETENINEIIPVIGKTYPLISEYLRTNLTGNEIIDSYFNYYKQSKLTNKPHENLISLMKNITNENVKIIYEYLPRNSIVDDIIKDEDALLFVDCFGAEYVSAFLSLFDDTYNVIVKYGYCNWPSTTENNNDFYKNRKTIGTMDVFDKLKHSNIQYPKNIETELNLLGDIKKTIDTGLLNHKHIILATDHGSSRMAVLAKGDSFKSDENAKIFYYGRFCLDKNNTYDFPGCIKAGDYWVFMNYNKFSQTGYPICEIHGGASLEETLVPIISISKILTNKQITEEEYAIILLTKDIKLPIDKCIEVKFKLEGNKKDLTVNVDSQYIKCQYEDNEYKYEQKINDKQNMFSAKIIENGLLIGTIEYNIIRPMENNKGFDI
jgi:hypothetical protein